MPIIRRVVHNNPYKPATANVWPWPSLCLAALIVVGYTVHEASTAAATAQATTQSASAAARLAGAGLSLDDDRNAFDRSEAAALQRWEADRLVHTTRAIGEEGRQPPAVPARESKSKGKSGKLVTSKLTKRSLHNRPRRYKLEARTRRDEQTGEVKTNLVRTVRLHPEESIVPAKGADASAFETPPKEQVKRDKAAFRKRMARKKKLQRAGAAAAAPSGCSQKEEPFCATMPKANCDAWNKECPCTCGDGSSGDGGGGGGGGGGL